MKKYFSLIIIGLVTEFNIACSQQIKNKDMKITIVENQISSLTDSIVSKSQRNFKEPYYTIYMRASECQFSIYVDDMMIFNHRGEKNIEGCPTGPLPINNVLLKSGIHTVTGKIYPLYGDKNLKFMSTLELSFNNREANNIRDREDEIFEIKASQCVPGKSNNGLEGLPYFEISKSFYTTIPYTLEGWSSSVDLKKYDEQMLKQEVNQIYNQIHMYIRNRNIEKLQDMYKTLMKMRAISFYFTQEEKQAEWESISQIINSNEYELLALPENAYLHFFANGKIVTLVDENANGIIRFGNKKDSQDIITLDLKFHKRDIADKLEII